MKPTTKGAADYHRMVLDTLEEGYCVLEIIRDATGRPTDYRFVDTNPAFERHTGLIDAVGRTAREMVPDLEDHWVQIYGRVALTGTAERFIQGSEAMGRWFEVEAFRVGEPDELRVALLFNDITARRAADERLREIEQAREEQLERERHARAEAEAFLGMLSHELRTPVTSIFGNASLIARDPAREDVGDLIRDVQEEADRLVRLIDDLLMLSRVDRGLIQLAPEPLLLQHVIPQVVEDVRRRGLQGTFDLQLPAFVPPVVADATALGQVLYNLFSNAAKYAGDAGPITISTRPQSSTVEVTVEDRGPGLGEDPEQLFGLYYRDPQTARLATGTGVGLYVARELIEAMSGTIEAWTRDGGGACFRICVPQAAEDDADSAMS